MLTCSDICLYSLIHAHKKIKCRNKLLDKKQVSVRRLYDWNKLLLPENDDDSLKLYDEDQFTEEEMQCFLQDAFASDDDRDTPSVHNPSEDMPALELRPGIKDMSFMGNKETRRKYKLQFDVFMTYIKEEAGGKVTEHAVCNFFHDKLEDKSIGVGSVWN